MCVTGRPTGWTDGIDSVSSVRLSCSCVSVFFVTVSSSSYSGIIECKEPIEVVSYKIGVCKVSPKGKFYTSSANCPVCGCVGK